MYKISKIGAFVLGIIGAILWGGLVWYYSDKDPFQVPYPNALNFMFILSYVLLAVAIIAAVVSAVKNILASPQALKKTLIYTGVFVVIGILSYIFAMGETSATDRWVSAGLIAFYILTAIASGLLIFTGVKNALTK